MLASALAWTFIADRSNFAPVTSRLTRLLFVQGEKEAAKGFRIGVDLSKKRKLEIGPGAGYTQVHALRFRDYLL